MTGWHAWPHACPECRRCAAAATHQQGSKPKVASLHLVPMALTSPAALVWVAPSGTSCPSGRYAIRPHLESMPSSRCTTLAHAQEGAMRLVRRGSGLQQQAWRRAVLWKPAPGGRGTAALRPFAAHWVIPVGALHQKPPFTMLGHSFCTRRSMQCTGHQAAGWSRIGTRRTAGQACRAAGYGPGWLAAWFAL